MDMNKAQARLMELSTVMQEHMPAQCLYIPYMKNRRLASVKAPFCRECKDITERNLSECCGDYGVAAKKEITTHS
jgi:hypothetical protein